ncbi:hypothetical protein AZE42_12230, partial [Rhizopogon vesiculosus]
MSTGIIIVFVTAFAVYVYNRRRSTLAFPLPPGPPPKFFTGNAHQLPQKEHWRTYA